MRLSLVLVLAACGCSGRVDGGENAPSQDSTATPDRPPPLPKRAAVPSRFFAIADDGILVTDDAVTWRPGPELGAQPDAIAEDGTNVVIIDRLRIAHVTSDRGATWQSAPLPLGQGALSVVYDGARFIACTRQDHSMPCSASKDGRDWTKIPTDSTSRKDLLILRTANGTLALSLRTPLNEWDPRAYHFDALGWDKENYDDPALERDTSLRAPVYIEETRITYAFDGHGRARYTRDGLHCRMRRRRGSRVSPPRSERTAS